MKKIDELYCKDPCYGSRKYEFLLNQAGYAIGRKKVIRLMRLMGISAIYRKPQTTIQSINHKKYPYLLKGVSIAKANRAWTSDITYIPMERGFMYLTVIFDWFSGKVLSRRLSNTLDGTFCVEALEEALERYGAPEIFNTGQGGAVHCN
jgi:putative transposase